MMSSRKRPQDHNGTGPQPAEKRRSRQSSTVATMTAGDYTPVYGAGGNGRRRNPDPHDSAPSSSPPKPRRMSTKSATPAPSGTPTNADTVPTPSPSAIPISPRQAQTSSTPTNSFNTTAQRAAQKRPPSATSARTTTNGNSVPSHSSAPAAPSFVPPTPPPPPLHTYHHSTSVPPGPPSTAKPKQERNIEKVMLGNLCFDTWYTSYYSKDLLGDNAGGGGKGGSKGGGKVTAAGANTGSTANYASPASSSTTGDSDPRPLHGGNKNTSAAKDDGAKASSARANHLVPVLERLYVCPCCFKYSKELVTWWAHVRYCQAKGYVPGEKIYVHPKGVSRVPVHPPGSQPAVGGGRRGSNQIRKAAAAAAEETKELANEGEYSIWEVDGEKDTLFCQNLSLFAKLFLETKSVFYDVTGFKYYILVYTPPESANADIKHRILGFFSKEKVSWDSNNLACILIFPPWQKKGFGNLLMGVSYEISRREGLVGGGPEKPISELGKKGYRRYWGGEISRWIEDELVPDENEEIVFDVDECSKATYIAPEDCLAILCDMGVVAHGVGPPKPKKAVVPLPGEPLENKENGPPVVMEDVEGTGEDEATEVRRVKMDKSQVRRWVVQNRISLEPPCDPDGFVQGYIQSSVEVD